ncbi:MAG: hypothetical protein F6K10_06750 [Moorea sp. SIO2B7]|nr:hypothetical protein [Moorena sp. SIO2B7]
MIWINGYLNYRIKDLYRQSGRESSLDVIINDDNENPLTLLDKISETGFQPPKLSGLDAYLEEQRKENILSIWQKFELYVKEDPQKLLRNCHPKKYPDCNCQLLAKKLFLKDPPETLAQIHRELQNLGLSIPDQTLRSHCKKKCLPLLQKILEDLGYSKEEES